MRLVPSRTRVMVAESDLTSHALELQRLVTASLAEGSAESLATCIIKTADAAPTCPDPTSQPATNARHKQSLLSADVIETSLGHVSLSLLLDPPAAAAPAAVGGDAVARTSAALLLVDTASLLFTRDRVGGQAAPWLLQMALLESPVKALSDSLMRRVVESFNCMRQAGLPGKLVGIRLAIMRAVVLFLRRPVVANNYSLAGRLHAELMSILPAWDKSGINVKGTCNVENVTTFKGGFGDTDASVPDSGSEKAVTFDKRLYQAIWGVQKYMADPKLAEVESGWTEMRDQMKRILYAFDALKVATSPAPPGPETRWPKYLTSPALLPLQLTDVHLRRSILTQFSMVLFFLEFKACAKPAGSKSSVLGKREKPDAGGSATPQPDAGPHSFLNTVFVEDRTAPGEGDVLKVDVARLLQAADGDSGGKGTGAGKGVYSFLDRAFVREKVWAEWKTTVQAERKATPSEQIRASLLSGGAGPDKTTSALKRARPTLLPLDDSGFPKFQDGIFCYDHGDASKRANDGHAANSGVESALWFAGASDEKTSKAKCEELVMKQKPKEDGTSLLERVQQTLEDDQELEEEYRNAANPAYLWRTMKAMSGESGEQFLAMVTPSPAQKASGVPLFDLRLAVAAAKPAQTGANGNEGEPAGPGSAPVGTSGSFGENNDNSKPADDLPPVPPAEKSTGDGLPVQSSPDAADPVLEKPDQQGEPTVAPVVEIDTKQASATPGETEAPVEGTSVPVAPESGVAELPLQTGMEVSQGMEVVKGETKTGCEDIPNANATGLDKEGTVRVGNGNKENPAAGTVGQENEESGALSKMETD